MLILVSSTLALRQDLTSDRQVKDVKSSQPFPRYASSLTRPATRLARRGYGSLPLGYWRPAGPRPLFPKPAHTSIKVHRVIIEKSSQNVAFKAFEFHQPPAMQFASKSWIGNREYYRIFWTRSYSLHPTPVSTIGAGGIKVTTWRWFALASDGSNQSIGRYLSSPEEEALDLSSESIDKDDNLHTRLNNSQPQPPAILPANSDIIPSMEDVKDEELCSDAMDTCSPILCTNGLYKTLCAKTCGMPPCPLTLAQQILRPQPEEDPEQHLGIKDQYYANVDDGLDIDVELITSANQNVDVLQKALVDASQDPENLLENSDLDDDFCEELQIGATLCRMTLDTVTRFKKCQCGFHMDNATTTCEKLFPSRKSAYAVYKEEELVLFDMKGCSCYTDGISTSCKFSMWGS